MFLLEVCEVAKNHAGGTQEHTISFALPKGQKLAIAGETGSGKTTLLKMIAGLLEPTTGSVFFNGERILMPSEQLIPGHPKIAFLSQHFELRNNYRVEELLDMARKISEARAHHIYKVCRIEHLLSRKTNQISGGEKQRIVLAQLLTTEPSLLLLDEPFSNLDKIHKQIMQDVIADIATHFDTTCILVSHDAADLLPWANRMVLIKNGAIIRDDNPAAIFYAPNNEYEAALLGTCNCISAAMFPIIKLLVPTIQLEQQLFIRPSQLILEKPAATGLQGKVTDVLFMGSYYLVALQMDGLKMLVASFEPGITVGETYNVSLKKDAIFHIL
jgi:iron(III) transport system ATP-binding protein